jgi:hypothetical protein
MVKKAGDQAGQATKKQFQTVAVKISHSRKVARSANFAVSVS